MSKPGPYTDPISFPALTKADSASEKSESLQLKHFQLVLVLAKLDGKEIQLSEPFTYQHHAQHVRLGFMTIKSCTSPGAGNLSACVKVSNAMPFPFL